MIFLKGNFDIIISAVFFLTVLVKVKLVSKASVEKTILSLSILGAYLFGTCLITHRVEDYVQNKQREKLIGFALSYAWVFEEMGHDKLNWNTKPQDPFYLKFIEYQKGWLKSNPFVSDIYTMKKANDGSFYLIVDSETDYDRDGKFDDAREARTHIGEVYEKQILELSNAFGGSPSFTVTPYEDKWGKWVSVFFPLYKDGIVNGVLGVDFPAKDYASEIHRARNLVLLCAFLLFTSIFGVIYTKFEQMEHDEVLGTALKKAEQATKTKSQFLANMSHEIRTPLNGILGMINLISDQPLRGETKERIDIMKRSADTLRALVNDILDFSKIEAGKLELELVDFHIPQTVSECISLLHLQSKQKGIAIVSDIDANMQFPWIRADLNRFRQVLTNLINNAIKFTPAGQVTVKVVQTMKEGNTVHLQVSITDTGIGIPDDVKKKLFQSFTQADGSTTRRFGGTGLGLAICKGIVESMGGTIWVESVLKKGSTFTFTVPAERAAEPPKPAVNTVAIAAPKRPLKILVADDHSTNRLLAVTYLEKLGYRADSVSNGLEVLDALDTKVYDVIFLDCQMPEMDGYTVAEKLRQRFTPTTRPWIIALTASVFKEEQEKCFTSGMDDFVAKPFDKNTLLNALERIKSSPSESKIFDSDRMVKHFGEDKDIMQTFVNEYLATSMILTDNIQTAIENKDSQRLRVSAHKLRGCISNFFAQEIQNDLVTLEAMGKTEELDEAQTLFKKVSLGLSQLNRDLADLSNRKAA